MRIFKHVQQNKALLRSNWLLAVAALLLAGAVYRVAASHLRAIVENPIILPVPLNSFPLRIDGWVGKNVPISETVQSVAGTDDFLNRLYVDKANNQWANVYVAYTARPRTMLGHQPAACYVASGWIHESTKQSHFVSSSGRTIPSLIHRFRNPGLHNYEVVVLNFYIVNGLVTDNEAVFTGIGWRTPNIDGNPARYVTQVQISSILENSVRRAAKDMADLMLDFFPDENGRVRAIEYANATSGVLK